ncbi:GHKL domain-containing protein [Gemmiger sp.]
MILEYLTTPNFGTTILGAVLLYLWPLRRRKQFRLRLVTGCVLFLAAALILRLQMTAANVSVSYALHIALGALLVYFCCDVSPSDALMAAVCGFATQFMATSVASLVYPADMMPNYSLEMTQFPKATFATVGIHVAFYLMAEFCFARKMAINGAYNIRTLRPLISAAILMVFAMYLNSRVRTFYYNQQEEISRFGLFYGVLCSCLYLCMQLDAQLRVQSAAQAEVEHVLRIKQREQYEQTKRSIDLMNQRCHKLKVQLAELQSEKDTHISHEAAQKLEEAVSMYDSAVRTQNPALDTVLTEKSLLCEQKEIAWTCMADGQKLAFMDTVDLYVLFGTLLDEAIAMTERVPEREKRVLAVNVFARNGMVLVQIENYCAEPPCGSLDDAVRQIVEKYHGTTSTEQSGDICLTKLLFPIPARQ